MLSDEISKSGRILPRDNESPSGHKMTPSVDDETPSNEEGRQNNVTATVIEGYKVAQVLKVWAVMLVMLVLKVTEEHLRHCLRKLEACHPCPYIFQDWN